MKIKYLLLIFFLFIFLSSFNKEEDRACEYVGSNIEYISSQTQKALLETDLNKTKYQIYKAINAIEKTKKKLKDCGCSYASKNLFTSLDNLVMSTKTSNLGNARIFLNRSLKNTASSLESLQEHHTHQSKYQNGVLSLNTKTDENLKKGSPIPNDRYLHQKIDSSLVKFEKSLDDVVRTIECGKAKTFTQRVFNISEKELLKENLSEGKKYYHLRTKAIAAEALKKLENCK
ncbi:hypothetical protein H0I23_09780 [Cellulophaga sp. HaHaR_3_176]|uniref:hypothetical protein n=1 Tax=Cellulophaga sp. HaHaR_3_176 TaxID=1942464 RepID=UPI001C1F74FA|nr:hypothetical protein [Cellulophaga sp. HaHaR_3_176]QWX82755.1 hypothetical protein H0I23_09780 [Cellulophaga sp. HaHaR_3_176]